MGDVGDDFRALKAYSAALRAKFGVDCPGCKKVQPKRIPTVMLPQQKCKVCGHKDPRPRLTPEQIKEATGAKVVGRTTYLP